MRDGLLCKYEVLPDLWVLLVGCLQILGVITSLSAPYVGYAVVNRGSYSSIGESELLNIAP